MSESFRTDHPIIKRLTDIVLANISNENFGVEDLAKEAGLSRITLYRKIKSVKNQDPTQFIKEIRLRKAMELLRQNEGTVAEIAFKVGFGSPAYFNKCFHDFFGFPPGKIKRETLKAGEEITPVEFIGTIRSKRPFHRQFIIPIGLLSFLVLISLGYFLYNSKSSSSEVDNVSGSVKSIAVLPFRNLTDSASSQYLVDGITGDILTNLSKIHDLQVLSRLSTEQFRGKSIPLKEIARELNVNYIVEGSIQKYGNIINLWANLTETTTGKNIWTHSYKEEIKKTSDIFGIQSQIAQEIASELNANITPEEKRLIERNPTSSLTALDFYQRGREELGKFPFHDLLVTSTTYPIFFDNPTDKKSLQLARQMFRTALKHDSAFAPAYADLAAIYWSENVFREIFSENYLDSVLFLANKALSFDDGLADAYYMRAMYWGETGKIKQARLDFDKTLQFDPNHWLAYYCKGALYLEEYPDADYTVALDNFLKAASRCHGAALSYLLQRIAYTLNITGFSELGLKYNLKASELEMDSARYFYSMFESGIWSGNADSDNTFGYLKKAFSKDSNNLRILWYYASYLGGRKDFNNSLKIYRKYLNLTRKHGITMLNDLHRIGAIFSELGMIDSAEYYYNKQIENCNTAIRLGRPYGLSFAYFDLAVIYGLKGDRENALENLRKFRKREGMVGWFMFGGFKNDQEFQQIRKEIYNKSQQEHEKVRKWLEDSEKIR